MSDLLNQLVWAAADRSPQREAVRYGTSFLTYEGLAAQVESFASGLVCWNTTPGWTEASSICF